MNNDALVKILRSKIEVLELQIKTLMAHNQALQFQAAARNKENELGTAVKKLEEQGYEVSSDLMVTKKQGDK